jgi:hypothetical protein
MSLGNKDATSRHWYQRAKHDWLGQNSPNNIRDSVVYGRLEQSRVCLVLSSSSAYTSDWLCAPLVSLLPKMLSITGGSLIHQ